MGLKYRHDLASENGKAKRGWKGLALVGRAIVENGKTSPEVPWIDWMALISTAFDFGGVVMIWTTSNVPARVTTPQEDRYGREGNTAVKEHSPFTTAHRSQNWFLPQ